MKTIEEIKRDWQDGLYYPDNKKYKLHPVSDNHIFDENLSIKENRRMIEEYNAQVKLDRIARQKEMAELSEQMHRDVVNYIVANYNLNEKQAIAVESRVYTDKHSCMSDYFYEIDEMAEFVEKLLSL